MTVKDGTPKPLPKPSEIWTTLNEPWCAQIQPLPAGTVMLINTADPLQFLAYFWTGLLANTALVLTNPSWKQQEWQQVAEQLSPDIVLGEPPPIAFNDSRPRPTPGQILIATGGTSGQIKFVIHTWATLTAAAQGFLAHFKQQPVNCYCVLPFYHVSGLMQAMRVWLSGGTLLVQPFKQLDAGQRQIQPDRCWVISLVPTQLQRLMEQANTIEWLTQFRAILLGGGPAWSTLLTQSAQLPIALTYGMSETAAQIATLLPEEFGQGIRNSGSSLPHVKLEIHHPESSQTQPAGVVGRIALQSSSLGLGYWPNHPLARHQAWFYPDDLGYLDQRNHLHVVGRNSQKIVSGGENVFPAEVVSALLTTGLVQDVCVLGLADQTWGQIVTALYVPATQTLTPQQIKQALNPILSSYKHPKHWQQVDQIPRNAQGKVSRSRVMALLTKPSGSAQGAGDDAGD